MKKYKLEIIVFITGAAIMVLELTGSRIIAPYLGNSIIVWTSLIGIILGFLSFGYWLGGYTADRRPNYKIFSLIIFLGAINIGIISFSQQFILKIIQSNISSIYFGTVIAAISLFSLPSLFLGMVSPFAARLKIKDIEKSGATIGNLYAVSTIGSILGTFLAGFFLIPFLGSAKILIVLSVVLAATSFLAYKKKYLLFRILFIIFLFIISVFLVSRPSNKNIIDIETRYNRIFIFESVDSLTKRPILNMAIDPLTIQSSMFLDRDDDLVADYLKYYRLAKFFKPDLKKSLLIGGAGYSYPKDYLEKNPEASLDVVEIDLEMTEIARKYFNLKPDSRLNIYHEDGRSFLNKNKKKYDAVFLDAFNSCASIPYHLTTVEAVKKIKDSLNESGVVITNIISSLEGEKSLFLQAEYSTYKEIFPQVFLFPIKSAIYNPKKLQNVILVALNSEKRSILESENMEFNNYLNHLLTKEIEIKVPILTDDYAPVDYYTMNYL